MTTADEAPPKPFQGRGRRIPFAAIILASLVVCAVIGALPSDGILWPLKLAVATYVVLLVPGAVVLRIVGWPRSPASALAASAVWSIAALTPGFALVFVFDRGFDVAIWWLLLVTLVGLVVGRGKPVAMDTRITGPILLLIGTVAAFALLVALARWNNVGDAVEHIARTRKLTELLLPRTLADINILPPDTGLHPGYAFPLWHAMLAILARITGIDEAVIFRSVPPLLVPMVAAATYAAGRKMFGCREAGVATWIGLLAVFGFPDFGVGTFDRLTYPGVLSIFLLWPVVVDRTFAYLHDGGREPPWTIAAASLVVAAIHPSYSPMMMMLIGAFAGARFIISPRRATEWRRLAIVVAAVWLPFLLLLIWLYPIAKTAGSTVLFRDTFGSLLDRMDGLERIKPGYVTRGGAATVAGLLLAPLAAAATKTRAAAFIASGTAVIVLVLIVPWLFTPFADIMSVSQGRRFIFYLPLAYSLVGASLVVARFRYFAVAAALALGTVLQIVFPGETTYKLIDPGPGWAAWLSAIGCLVMLAVGVTRRLNLRYSAAWVLPVILAFTVPIAIAGLPETQIGKKEGIGFAPQILGAVRENVDRDDVLMGNAKTSYRLTAFLPVYIAAAKTGHGGDTLINRHEERRLDVAKFFRRDVSTTEAQAILDRWDVDWLLVDKNKPYPEEIVDDLTPVFDGRDYALYPVGASAS